MKALKKIVKKKQKTKIKLRNSLQYLVSGFKSSNPDDYRVVVRKRAP